MVARDLISSSGCREFSPEHHVLLGFFLVEGRVAGKGGGVVQKWHARFLSFLKKLRDGVVAICMNFI